MYYLESLTDKPKSYNCILSDEEKEEFINDILLYIGSWDGQACISGFYSAIYDERDEDCYEEQIREEVRSDIISIQNKIEKSYNRKLSDKEKKEFIYDVLTTIHLSDVKHYLGEYWDIRRTFPNKYKKYKKWCLAVKEIKKYIDSETESVYVPIL